MHPFLAMIVPMGAAPGSPDNALPSAPVYPTGQPLPPGITPPGIWPPPAGPPPHVPTNKVLILVYRGNVGWQWAVIDPSDVPPAIDNTLPDGRPPGIDNTLPPSAGPKK